MKDFVAVLDAKLLITPQSFKRSALLFDRIAVPRFIEFWQLLKKYENDFGPALVNDLDWLFESQIIFEPELEISEELLKDKEFFENYDAAERSHTEFKALPYPNFDDPNERKAANERMALFIVGHGIRVSRCVSVMLRRRDNFDAFPLISVPTPTPVVERGKSEVVSIVLNNIPIPDEQTSWEQILEFRSDPDTKDKFFRLRRWMREVAKEQLSPIEVEEKVESLLHDYERHMKLHQLKINKGAMETLVTTSAELIENLIKFNWGKAAKTLFTLKERKVALMEAEMNAPGAELAYLYKSKEYFDGQDET